MLNRAATAELVVTSLVLWFWPQLFAWIVYAAEFSDVGEALAPPGGRDGTALYPAV